MVYEIARSVLLILFLINPRPSFPQAKKPILLKGGAVTFVNINFDFIGAIRFRYYLNGSFIPRFSSGSHRSSDLSDPPLEDTALPPYHFLSG